MKLLRVIYALPLFLFLFGGCVRKEENDFSYQLEGVGDVTVEAGVYQTAEWTVRHTGGTQQTVRINDIKGLPGGVQPNIRQNTGNATFSTFVDFNVADTVHPGTYPYTVQTSSMSIPDQTYTGNLIVAPGDCTSRILGIHYVYDSCGHGVFQYSVAFTKENGTKNNVLIKNFSNYGDVYADLDCSARTLNISPQQVGSVIISGTGTFANNVWTVNYTAVQGATTFSCKAVLVR